MSDLIQIVYVSRSTFTTMPAEFGIEPSVARILTQSRINNARRGLVGALYFGDGCFFQCLEGRTAEVDRLYATLLQDPRHTELRVLSRTPIERTSFDAWSMKYVPLDAPMNELLRELDLKKFDPYLFDEKAVAKVLHLLGTGGDFTPVNVGLEQIPAPGVTTQTTRAVRWTVVAVIVIGLGIASTLVLRAFA